MYRKLLVFIIGMFLMGNVAHAQQDTLPVSVNPALLDIFQSKYPKNYTIAGISVTGAKAFDANLIASISGLAIGDKVLLLHL